MLAWALVTPHPEQPMNFRLLIHPLLILFRSWSDARSGCLPPARLALYGSAALRGADFPAPWNYVNLDAPKAAHSECMGSGTFDTLNFPIRSRHQPGQHRQLCGSTHLLN